MWFFDIMFLITYNNWIIIPTVFERNIFVIKIIKPENKICGYPSSRPLFLPFLPHSLFMKGRVPFETQRSEEWARRGHFILMSIRKHRLVSEADSVTYQMDHSC